MRRWERGGGEVVGVGVWGEGFGRGGGWCGGGWVIWCVLREMESGG